MKLASNFLAILSLLAANLVPLVGVWYWGWNISSIMLLYWAESAIIGYFAIKKMHYLDLQSLQTVHNSTQNKPASSHATHATFTRITINGRTINSTQELNQTALGAMFFIPFFVMHYGIFMFVHLIFLLIFFFSLSLDWWAIAIGLASLFFSHYVSYQTNFINGGEFKRTSVPAEMFKPYPRIIVMHLTIILGAIFVMSQGGHTMALILLVVLKIIIDVVSHLAMHWSPKAMVINAHSGKSSMGWTVKSTNLK